MCVCISGCKPNFTSENYNSNKDKLTTIPLTVRHPTDNDISSQIYNKNKIDRRSIFPKNIKNNKVNDYIGKTS